ncbi:MAG: MlaD family protein [Bdellovibrionaceae bacterium]|nr:MlaD family protein [Pseudobdellovibrionaceae bacterium]
MEPAKFSQAKVGIFVAFGLLSIMVSIFLLGGDAAFFRSYTSVFAKFNSVQGLNTGSIVSLSGVTIGNVREISFHPEENKLLVEMRVETKYLRLLTEGTSVDIRTQGALGDKYIFVIPGSPGGSPLQPGALLPTLDSTDLIGMITERGKETERIFDIINEVYRITSSLNKDNRFDKIMSNLALASTNLKDATSDAKKIASQLSEGGHLTSSIKRLDSIMTKLDRGEGTLGALINDKSLHEQLKTFLGGSNRTKDMKSVIRSAIERSGGGD